MSNARLIGHIEQALARYERGELTASDVERAVDLHLPALDRIGAAERSEAEHLVVRLVNADLSNPPAVWDGQPLTFEGDEATATMLRDFRAFLSRLPR